MAASKKTIKKIQVDGIDLTIDTERLVDVRFTYALGKVTAEETPDAEKLVWYMRMLDTLFGNGRVGRVVAEGEAYDDNQGHAEECDDTRYGSVFVFLVHW